MSEEVKKYGIQEYWHKKLKGKEGFFVQFNEPSEQQIAQCINTLTRIGYAVVPKSATCGECNYSIDRKWDYPRSHFCNNHKSTRYYNMIDADETPCILFTPNPSNSGELK